MTYFYGPIHSRRLGWSLGVDLLPDKVCSFQCLYCQVGRTVKKTMRRFTYVDMKKFRKELNEILRSDCLIDYITISGKGEPTLHKNLDTIIKTIKKIANYNYPVCVITNSSLLYRKDVRRELKDADLVIPSLDAPNEDIFRKIDSPHNFVSYAKLLEGLIAFRREFKGKIWLEIMLVKGINDSEECAKDFKKIIKRLNPDKVQINLPVRTSPLTQKSLIPPSATVKRFCKIIDDNVEVVL
ncbi:MAG: radical SAM protein [Candidatus Omnitrophica bacterium]|nr:radical SAM protein [Candidatus Omnitrophota bacterium]MCM8827223.1 radical SAM protein [Candidatus Omnitrophota bacterium]